MENMKLVKELAFGEDARSQVLTGVDKLTKAVSSTLGPSGKCVILEDHNGKPQITKDGVTVANSIILRDPLENIGATLVKEAAQRTVRDAGDGTTTATILAKEIINQFNLHDKAASLRDIKDGINSGVDKVLKYLKKKSKKVKGNKISQVAAISANNDKVIGDLIGKAFKMVDETGVVMMEINNKPETSVELIEGLQYNKGFKNTHFITNSEKGIVELDNALVLVVESRIDNIRKIQPVLEHVIKHSKSLLLVADVDQQVESALSMNKVKGNINVSIIDAPNHGLNRKEILQDIALVTKSTLVNEDLGDDMDLIDISYLGKCLKVTSSAFETTFKVDSTENEKLEETISNIKSKIKKATSPEVIVMLETRLAKLNSKMAVVKVGASSEVELKEKKDRVEDAICATKAAIKEGIVPGGGVALLNASQILEPKNIGEEVLYCAIRKPYETILSNAGISDHNDEKEGLGLNVVTGRTVDMVKAGIIDPLLVTKSALLNAASVANTIMSTDCVVNNVRNEGDR